MAITTNLNPSLRFVVTSYVYYYDNYQLSPQLAPLLPISRVLCPLLLLVQSVLPSLIISTQCAARHHTPCLPKSQGDLLHPNISRPRNAGYKSGLSCAKLFGPELCQAQVRAELCQAQGNPFLIFYLGVQTRCTDPSEKPPYFGTFS